MKKLLFAFAAVATAVAVNAASITWRSGTMTLPSGASETGMGGITAYLFVLNSTDYAKITGVDYVYNTYYSQLASATKTATSVFGATSIKEDTSYSSGNSAYGALIYTAKNGDKDYYIANYGTYTFDSSYDKTMQNMGLKLNGTGSALSWSEAQAVPEPFSGTLALLGMGVVALRRRMKKQMK